MGVGACLTPGFGKRKEVALITILRIFSTHTIAGAVHEYDIKIVPFPHQKKVGGQEEFLNRFKNKVWVGASELGRHRR